MKNLIATINEGLSDTYSVSVNDIQDSDNLPVTITMTCPTKYRKQMEKWIEKMIDNEFAHAAAQNYNWEAE